MIDPFTQVSQRIATVLQAYPGFSALVNPGNFRQMTQANFTKFAENISTADTPEFVLLQTGFNLKPFGSTSQKAELTQAFQLIQTANNLVVTPVNKLKFAIFVALFKAGDTLGLDGLVMNWEITGGLDDAWGQKEWKRDALRWVSHCTIVVQMDMGVDQLLAY